MQFLSVLLDAGFKKCYQEFVFIGISFFLSFFYFCLQASLTKGVISAAVNQHGYRTRALQR